MRVIGACESWKRCRGCSACLGEVSVEREGGGGRGAAMADTRVQEEEERQPLVQTAEEQVYKGEKEPENKHSAEEHQEEQHGANGGSERNVQVPARGVPVGPEGIVMGEPISQPRRPWSTGLFSCLGSNDEFCSSDIEVCVLGLFAPCVLYGSNMERLQPGRSTFASHCMAYSSLYMMGNFLFNGNFVAPVFSFASRIALRRSQNLEGYGESLVKSAGCCTGLIDSSEARERLDGACDFAVHFCCHPCSLCQEGREIRRRTVHPAQAPQFYTLAAPSQQSME